MQLPGHDRRARRRRRLVRFGDPFTSDELDAGTVELEEPEPSPEDEDLGGANEPWGRDGSKDESERDRGRLAAYLEFLRQWREDHPGEDSGEEAPGGD